MIAASFAVCLAQAALAIPASVSGLLQISLKPVGTQLTWASNAFLLPLVVLALPFGAWGDRLGLKRLLVGGAVLITAGEAVTAAGDGIHQVWAGQAIAGVGAAALFPASLTMVTAGTQTTRARASAIAIYAAALGAGGLVTQILRGASGEDGSWRWPFALAAGLGVLSALLSQLLTRNSSSVHRRTLDTAGQIFAGVGLLALLYAVVEGGAGSWSDTGVIVGFVVAAASLGLFILVESRAQAPLLRLGLFTDRAFAVGSFATVVGMFAYYGTVYAVGTRVGVIQGQSALHLAGAASVLSVFPVLLLPVIPWLLERVSSRWTLATGLLLIAAGAFIAAGLPISDSSLASIVLALTPVGVGFALTLASTISAVNTTPVHEAGMTSAALSMLRNLGFTLGPALIGAIALRHASGQFDTGLASAPLPPQVKGAIGTIADAAGPLAVNAVPQSSPAGAARSIAFDALGSGFSLGLTVCGIAALVACLLAVAVRPGAGPGPVPEVENDSLRQTQQTST
ncbi:MFS transporter [Streptomyces griseorubiginosus]|uniref:MFS transporter n=1 Tax=Streptomyces griseorubiginosus TaxID=67304 RepID=UPI00244E0957|nr:MFS transporter [Streptomyces griseorubiginosus]